MAERKIPKDPKSHDPAADSETAWHGRDRFPPKKPGSATPAGSAREEPVPPAHPPKS
jgi:hypothetical protein